MSLTISLSLEAGEAALTVLMLKDYSSILGKKSCNDFPMKADSFAKRLYRNAQAYNFRLSPDVVHEHPEYDDPEKHAERNKGKIIFPDFLIASYLANLIEKQVNTSIGRDA